MDVGTQTEKAYVRNTRKEKQDPVEEAKPPVQEVKTPVQEIRPPEPPVEAVKPKIQCCDFEVFGIVQGLF